MLQPNGATGQRTAAPGGWPGLRCLSRVAPRVVRRLSLLVAFGLTACASPTPSFVDCSVFADSRASLYVLPFAAGQKFIVSRTFGHYTPGNDGVGLYAIDFPMPMRTPVHAVRSGTVVAVEQRYSDDDRTELHENWVMIRHSDRTVARYIHLTMMGALVRVGDSVRQGDVIGLSGNSGPSSEPHLHFDVQTCGPNLPPGLNRLPCGMTVPVSFRNTEAHACGLTPRKSYAALPFVADER